MTRHNWGPEQWAAYIIEAHGKTVAAIMEVGNRFAQLKEEAGGDMEAVCDLTGYKKSYAYAHIKIHSMFSSSDGKLDRLPASWTSLAELTRIDSDKIEAVLDAGLVTRSSTRRDIVTAVKTAKNILPQDFRIEYGKDYYEEMREAIIDFQVVTDAAEGETAQIEEDAESEEEGHDEETAVQASAEDPRVTTIRDMQRGFLMWVDNTEKPFADPMARKLAEGFVKELAHRLGLAVVDKAA